MSNKQVTFTIEGHAYHLTQADDKAVKEALSAQAGLSDRYLKTEPAISAAFGAPACYEKGTEERKALLAYLGSRHPLADRIEKQRAQQEAAQAKGDPTAAHDYAKGARIDEEKRDVDVQNAIRAFKRYFEAQKQGKRERSEVGPRDKATAFAESLKRYYKDGSQWPMADQKLARALYAAVSGVLEGKTSAPDTLPSELEVAGKRTVGDAARKAGEVLIKKGEAALV